ncbi:cellulose biosynthesis protein BcsN [Ancylobacter radicis]|uniref:cellulose biosynthesis protein BcsN n=1 Tax=Ancylobacter radicis TaxID=2836179 RepID=UPI00351018BA
MSVALGVAGCAPYPLVGQNPQVATATVEVPVSEALVLPEPGSTPRVITVLETDYINAVEQEIVLETQARSLGQNAIHVVFFGPVKGRTGWENLKKDDYLNDELLDEEMLERVPGVTMHVSNYFVQNRYGPFNYAIGNAGNGELCIYAWQRIQSQVPLYVIWRDRGILSMRLRLCQVGASEQDLLRVMYRYSINGYFLPQAWQPYGKPMGEPLGLGQIGGPLSYPSGLQGDGTVLDGWMGADPNQVSGAPAPASRTRVRSARRYGSPVPQAEPVYQPGAVEAFPQGNLVDPVEGYPQVPGPGVSSQLAPSTTPKVTPGQVPAGAVVDRAPARPVQSPSQSSPFATPPTLPGVSPALPNRTAPSSSVGDPVRLVPGASSYPAPSQ